MTKNDDLERQTHYNVEVGNGYFSIMLMAMVVAKPLQEMCAFPS